MRISKLISLAGLSVALSATANAQFSVSGGSSAIPASGTGGEGGATYDTIMPAFEATSAVAVGVAVTSIDSIQIDGLGHTWVGDTQATLEDPNGVEHLIWLRPGYLNTGNFGNSGDFDGGTYTIVGDGSGASLPTTSGTVGPAAGTYNQTFSSGAVTWVSGTNGINNTPMASISGPAGSWSLNIYDWAGGDSGSFSAWTLNGNGAGGGNTGAAYCAGSAASCPCGNNSAAAGCINSTGAGMSMTGTGNADTGADTFSLDVAGGPVGKPGIFFQGTNSLNNPLGDGAFCSNASMRYSVQILGAAGDASISGLGVNSGGTGSSVNYQFWYRDPSSGPCAGGFNFSNAWNVTWN